MKRIYETRAERSAATGSDTWDYKVVATHGVEAANKTLRQAKIDSGFKTGWRISRVQELDGFVIP